MSPDVSAEIGHMWATRKPPVALDCTATRAEQRVFDELYDVWIDPKDGRTALSPARAPDCSRTPC